MDHILITTLRTLIGFMVLLFLTRILGKKQLSQMTFFTYITGIALGNIAGDMVVHRDIKIVEGITGLSVWAFLTVSIEYLSLKVPKARVLLDGEPTIIIKNGKLHKKAMAKNKLNMDDLTMLLRTKDVFSIKEVDYAILEPNGELSLLKKVEKGSPPRLFLPSEIIVDGKIVQRNLKELNLTIEWLENQLKGYNIHSVKDVFFAELQEDGSLYIDEQRQG